MFGSHAHLRGTGDHVLDEVTVTRGVDDGDHVAGGLELPKSNVDGDTTLALGLQLVEDPSVLEGTLAEPAICGGYRQHSVFPLDTSSDGQRRRTDSAASFSNCRERGGGRRKERDETR